MHNNVGATRLGGPEELTLDEWRATFAVNLDSVFLGVQQTLPHLLDRGGSIINVSSTASIRWTGYPYPAYAAAKAAVNQLTRALALQYADRGVRVNAILAGLIDTPLVYRELSGGRSPDVVRAERAALCPTGAMGSAYDVAHAALFLASDESAYVTGTLLPVDGGLHVASRLITEGVVMTRFTTRDGVELSYTDSGGDGRPAGDAARLGPDPGDVPPPASSGLARAAS